MLQLKHFLLLLLFLPNILFSQCQISVVDSSNISCFGYNDGYILVSGSPGQSYRAQGRTFCDSNITAYRSPTWTSPIFWTQPGNIRMTGGTAISDLEIYPNPSDNLFNISFSSDEIQDLKIRILNVIGAEVYVENKEEFVGEYTKQISLHSYRKGIYFLEIETNNGIINKKLILQ